jgi:hypothetical protein
MIKLIACDLDGTLLPPTKIMPPETFELIESLAAKGIVFAPASGRQLPNLQKLFAPVLDKIAIIAENGGIVWYGGEIIYSDPTPSEDVMNALDTIAKVDNLYPLLSCADCAYYVSGYEKFTETVAKSYSNRKRAESFEDVVGSNVVYKISVWDDKPAAEHGGVVLPPMLPHLRVMVSGYDWLDVSAPLANKGKAMVALADKLGAAVNETVAFGDHMNDYEMLAASGRAYVPQNAFPPLKAKVGEVIPSNADGGVITKLKELLQEIK